VAVTNSVLVTGAAGGVGRTVCRILTDQGVRVRGLVRPEDDRRGLDVSPDDLMVGYVEDPRAVFEAMQGVDVVVHCAGLLPNALHLGADAFHRVNVDGALNVLKQAGRLEIPRAVFFSTISVVDHITRSVTTAELQQYIERPHDAHLSSKIDLEKALERESKCFNGEIIVLRPAFIYGPGNFAVWHDALRLVRRGKMILIADGNARLPLIYAEDIARFVWVLLRRPLAGASFRIHIVANPEPTTMKQVFDFIADYWGVKRPRKIPCWPLTVAASVAALLPERLRVGRLRLLTKARVLQYSKGYDLSQVITPPSLGFSPETGYREGLVKMLDDYTHSVLTREKS
jgi:nucleoside-diphosphate-sugar epimerase